METLFLNYNRLEKALKDYEDMIFVTQNSPYYLVFEREEERQKDLSDLNSAMAKALSTKYDLLEEIKRQAELQMRVVSQEQRKYNLLKQPAA